MEPLSSYVLRQHSSSPVNKNEDTMSIYRATFAPHAANYLGCCDV